MTEAFVVRAGDGEAISAAGVAHVFALLGEQTGDRLGLARFTVPPGVVGATPHVHHEHDETFYVMQGSLTVATSQGEEVLHHGDLAHAPRGSVHGFRNADGTTDAVALCIYTPPGYEGYFREVHEAAAQGRELTADLLSELRSHYATEAAAPTA